MAAAAVVIAACGGAAEANESQEVVDESLRFDGSLPALDALGRHVLTSLARRDTAALQRSRLTEYEHNEVVWPELPASAPEVNYPIDYAWANVQNRNTRGLARILPLYAGQQLRFQSVECRGGVEEFETFVVETDCYVVFVRGDSPQRWQAQIFKDVLQRGGGYKVFRYYDEEPEPYRERASD